MRIRGRGIRRTSLRILLVLAIGLILVLVAVTQTPIGKELVLREVLAQVEGGINGRLEISGVSSPGLLNGFTFRDVTIRGEDGRPFLEADSVRAGVSAPALLRGDLVLTGVRVWNPRVTLERFPDQDRMNAVAIFLGLPEPDSVLAPADSVPPYVEGEGSPEGRGEEAGTGSRTILIRGAELYGGTLEILLPLSPQQRGSERILTELGADGPPQFRRYTFREIELRLGNATIRSPNQTGERFEVEHLAFSGEVWPESFRVTGARGEVRRDGGRLVAALESISLPNSEAGGRLDIRWGGDLGLRVEVDGAEARPLALGDLSFIETRLPDGLARGPFGFTLNRDGFLLDFQDTDLDSEYGRIRAQGKLFLGRRMAFEGLDLDLQELDMGVTDAWVADTLSLRGWLDGNLSLDGSLAELAIEGDLDLTSPDSAGTARAGFYGRMGFEDGFSASSLELTLAPLEWAALASLSPAMTPTGSGAVRLVLTGSLWGDGLGIDGELTHVPTAGPVTSAGPAGPGQMADLGSAGGASRVTIRGSIRRDSSAVHLDLTSGLSPLSLTALKGSIPSIPVQGEYRGMVEASGTLSDLGVVAELETTGGPVILRTRFDARRQGDSYDIQAEAREDFVLSALLPGLPESTRLRGMVELSGQGFDLESVEGEGRALVTQGTVGPLRVDSASVAFAIRDGILQLEEFLGETEAGTLTASGSFGVAPSASPGELSFEIRSESLEPLRPFMMEEPEFILDELSDLEKRILPDLGVDLDTLPTSAEVAVGGSVEARGLLRGGLQEFRGEGTIDFQGLRLRTDFVESGTISFSGEGFPKEGALVTAQIDTDSVSIRTLGYQRVSGDVEIGRREGRVLVAAHKSQTESYTVRGTYVLDSVGGGVANIDELNFQFDSVRWNLGGPAAFGWGKDGYRFRDFQIIRPGTENMRVRADGFLPVPGGGETDFSLEIDRLNLDRLARAFQVETPMLGVLDIRAHMTGPPSDPSLEGNLGGTDLLFSDFSLDEVGAEFSYSAERFTVDVKAQHGGRQVLEAEGFFPADLRLGAGTERIPEAPVDLSVVMDSFPAATALAFLETLEEVQGSLTGEVQFGGTSRDLEPSGELRLTRGEAVLPALGVRHEDVEALLTVSSDGTVTVEADVRADGTARVTGTVALTDPLSDPELDLMIEAENFLAVNRRDVEGHLSGSVDIQGSYQRPLIGGNLTVDEGVLRVEEVARSVEVVDLSNPAFFDVVDTTLATLRPSFQGAPNPFLRNLRLDSLTLTMAQDGWLRGRELNVEMAGTLEVYWDRTERNLAFLGVLDAVRGVYSVFGRQFQVEEGTVSFPGTPGINPDLSIRAMNRVRISGSTQLDIFATVTGALLEPRVALSSNAAFSIAESDLVSYLVFGRPSYATASAQKAFARDAAGVFAGAASSLAVGLFSSELGAILAEDVGLDYLAITQGSDEALGMRALRGTVATTQVEIGQYLTEDVFAALHWRPFSAGTTQRQLAALRLETRLSDRWTLEGYWEDRFFRDPIYQVGSLGLDLPSVLGFFVYRQWGY